MARIPLNYEFQLANPSQRTIVERNRFAAQIDNFATFQWAGIDMFKEFGVFIINEKKGSLKMYNGASFKNEYAKQQYQEGYTNLTGVTFDTQTINFTVGVYWFSIEDYRVLMNFLHPYKVDMLSFGFEPTYGYECKLTAIKDSTRHILGKESSNIPYIEKPTNNWTVTEFNDLYDFLQEQGATSSSDAYEVEGYYYSTNYQLGKLYTGVYIEEPTKSYPCIYCTLCGWMIYKKDNNVLSSIVIGGNNSKWYCSTFEIKSAIRRLNHSNISGATTSDGYRYYTELQLTFEVVGKQCAKEITPRLFDSIIQKPLGYGHTDLPIILTHNDLTLNGNQWPSDLDYPFKLAINNLVYNVDGVTEAQKQDLLDVTIGIRAKALFGTSDAPVEKVLFEIYFNPAILTQFNNGSWKSAPISLEYDSEQGLVYWDLGDHRQILSLLSTNSNGLRFVKYLHSNRVFWPGRLDHYEVFTTNNNEIQIVIEDLSVSDSSMTAYIDSIDNIQYSTRRRTNVL